MCTPTVSSRPIDKHSLKLYDIPQPETAPPPARPVESPSTGQGAVAQEVRKQWKGLNPDLMFPSLLITPLAFLGI